MTNSNHIFTRRSNSRNNYYSQLNSKSITFKVDEDNDIYEITINNVTYTLDEIYDSEYSDLFDELNLLIDKY